ncbi:MAG: hypothetical protein UHW99_01250 [Methanobrevibacter sp.]|uniref:hypothetical protein n=1 Tax=uncultured Methanobrevibacter sp. TaxID=253161 RepID=UPI0025EF4CA7|nr:hypothetical protein [uncultured Methanobrevibacter sp.]MEE1128589.1 hypothetical protein [Methanobrevibacter sp.]
MEKQSKYLILLIVIFVICIGVFLYQYNNDVVTFMIVNETQVAENGSFSGILMDSYSRGVANKTITYHPPGNQTGEVNVTTDENGEFSIRNAVYTSNSNANYYSNFTFAGDDKYKGCSYDGNVTVIAK